MEQSRVDMFVASMSEKFPSERLMVVRDQLSRLDDSKLPIIQSIDYKSPITMLLISWFLGVFGVDRFMLGHTGLGIGKLLTCGGLGIWALIDLFLIMGATKEYNYLKFSQVAF